MRVFVLGGTGAIGRPAVASLVRDGHHVKALARSEQKAAALTAAGAEPVEVSMFDRVELAKHFAGCDAVVNLASAMPSSATAMFRRAYRRTERIRVEGSAAVVDAALEAGVPRFVQESITMLYPDRGDAWIDETVDPDPFPTSRANLAAEANAHRFTESAGAGVVLRFGLFYGPGARHSEEFFALASRHVVPVLGHPSSYVSSIHIEDGGAAVAAALDIGPGTYNVVDDEPLTKLDYATALATAAGTRPWIRGPGRLTTLLGDRAASLTRSMRVANTNFRDATGWSPSYRSAREGWAATAGSLKLLDS